jgi:uncharacterized DUF497 family protein
MMGFEWNRAKADANFKKHGVRFEDAIVAFDDPFALIAFDEEHSHLEVREILLGRATRNVVVVVFTVRSEERHRIISARRATREERRRYEESKAISF